MMNDSIPLCESMRKMLACVLPVFTVPSGARFLAVAAGWLLGTGRRTVSGMLRAGVLTAAGHFSSYYRFFSEAAWSEHTLCRLWATAMVRRFYPRGDILLCGDDTLLKHRGAKVYGAGIFRDAVLSGNGMTVFHWGHNWMVLALMVQFRRWPHRWLALPINFRLRAKGQGATAVELMREMFHEAQQWFAGRTLVFCVDGTYSNLCGHLPAGAVLIGRLRGDAALFEPVPCRRPGQRGRPRVRGPRRAAPQQVAADPSTPWVTRRVWMYRQRRTVQVHSFVAIWSHVSKGPVRVVLSRDPTAPDAVEYFFCTDLRRSLAWVIQTYAGRWSIERTFEDTKQCLGIEHPQVRTERSVRRIVPVGMILYGAVICWYVQHAARSAPLAPPWYRGKTRASFKDMLAAAASRCRRQYFFSWSAHRPDITQIIQTILRTLERAA